MLREVWVMFIVNSPFNIKHNILHVLRTVKVVTFKKTHIFSLPSLDSVQSWLSTSKKIISKWTYQQKNNLLRWQYFSQLSMIIRRNVYIYIYNIYLWTLQKRYKHTQSTNLLIYGEKKLLRCGAQEWRSDCVQREELITLGTVSQWMIRIHVYTSTTQPYLSEVLRARTKTSAIMAN